MDRTTGEAVAQYRNVTKLQLRLELEEARLARMVQLHNIAMEDYVSATMEIDRAADNFRERVGDGHKLSLGSVSSYLSNTVGQAGRG